MADQPSSTPEENTPAQGAATPPASPASSGSTASSEQNLSREELLKQAAEAPTASFILPTSDTLNPITTSMSVPPLSEEPTPAPVVPPTPIPIQAPSPPVTPPTAVPPPPSPAVKTTPSVPPPPPPPAPKPVPITPPPAAPKPPMPPIPAAPSPFPSTPQPRASLPPIPPAPGSAKPAPVSPPPRSPFISPVPPLAAKPSAVVPNTGGPTPPPLQIGKSPVPLPKPVGTPVKPGPSIGFGTPGTAARSRNVLPLIIGAVLLVVLLFGAGAAYLFARKGSRLPFIYTHLTGLPTSGTEVAANALSYATSQTSYQFRGDTTLSVNTAASPSPSPGDRPILPLTVTPGRAGAVASIKSHIESGQYQHQQTSEFIGKEQVTVNDTFALDTTAHTGVVSTAGSSSSESADPVWVLYVAGAASPEVISVNDGAMHKTLLYPALQPIMLETLLKSVDAETAYRQEVSGNGITQTAYAYSVKNDMLASAFPADSTLKDTGLIVRFTQKQGGTAGIPVEAQFKGTMVYKDQEYAVDAHYFYTGWSQILDVSMNPDLAKVTTTEGAISKTVAEVAQLLGILSLDALPNTLSDTDLAPPSSTPVTTSSPTPISTATPSAAPTATPASTAITPTGESVTVAGTPLSYQPPVPPSIPGAQANAHDTQRLKDLQDLKTALENYKKDTGSYPVALSLAQTGASGTLISALVPKYLTAMPIDPTKTVYWYGYYSDGNTFTVSSVAEDGSRIEAKVGYTYRYFEVTNN
jgi:hypothetical protein